MKLNFYMDNVKRLGGERNIHFNFIDATEQLRRMKKRLAKKRAEHKIRRPLLETLNSYLEASRCRTLEKFIKEAKT
jgi:hypothetical protein